MEHSGPSGSDDDITVVQQPLETSVDGTERSHPGLAPGARLGRYVLLEEVGSGGMGVVMVAYDHELGRRVALKLLRPGMSRSGEARMQREAQSLAQLQHPAVVTVYEVGKVEGQRFIAMEYVEGQTFEKWAAPRRSQWRKLVEVAIRAGRGLAAAHAAGLVHRDVKPSNILVGRDGRVCVADFGIATATGRNTESGRSGPQSVVSEPGPSGPQSVSSESRSQDTVEVAGSLAVASPMVRFAEHPFTEVGAVVGTPAYMAPEQHRGDVVDARSDQFAFCVALYRVLYDSSPYAGDDLDALRRSIVAGKVDPAPSGTRVPAAVRRVLLRGLEAEPSRRWPTMTALLDALERALGRRRRWAAAIGIGVTAGVVAIAVAAALGEAGPTASCPAADERLAGVWDEERAVQLREGFVATELPYALDSWTRTRDRLDRHAESWSARYQTLCEAMGDRTAGASVDMEMACLTRRREELGALVDLLAEADAATVAKAIQAATELQSVDSCAAAGQEAAAMAEPAASQRAAVDEIRLTLARAEAAFKTGTFAVGIGYAQQARDQAEAVGYLPAEVEALYRLGQLQGLSGQLDEASKNLGEAALRAVEVRHERVAAQAATMQAFVVGYQQGQHDEGLRWLRHATAALSRLGPDPLLEAEWRVTRAAIISAQGRYDEALADFRRALQQREQHLGPDHPIVASSYNNLGSTLVQQGQYDKALEAMEHAREIWVRSYGPQHPVVAAATNGIGVVLERVGRLDDARRRLEDALALREAAFGPEHVNVALTLDNLGSVLMRLGRYEEAQAASQRALTLRERSLGPTHPHVASSLVNLGLVAEKQGRLDQAEDYLRRAMDMWEESLGAEHPYLGFPLTGLGRIEHARGRDAPARELLERALKIREGLAEPQDRAETELALAQALWSDDPTRARALAERAMVGLEETPHTSGALGREIEAWLQDHPPAP